MEHNYSFQLKIRGDDFNGRYTNGLSMSNSVSVHRCKRVYDDADKSVFECEQYRVTAFHVPCEYAVKCYTVFENLSDESITLDMISSFCIDDLDVDTMHRATSFWSAEGKLLSQSLTDLNMERSWSGHGARVERFGQIGSMPVRKYFPFVALENSESKEVIGVQLHCPSSWQIELYRTGDALSVYGGIADFDFGHWCKTVMAGDSFTTPVSFVALDDSLLGVCDSLVKSHNPNISPVDEDMPVVFNEYCVTWGNPTKENIEKIAKRISGTGIKYLVIDSGWYKEASDGWWETIGDWDVNKTLFPNGIKEIVDLIKSYGFIPGIWFEFEKVAWKTKVYNEIDHMLKRDGVPISVDGQRFFDMRDEWVIDYLTKKVIHFLRDNGFGYIKIDYNDSIGVGCDGDESLGEGLRQTVLGTQRFFEKIKQELSDIVIEGCSSGGHRLEPSMMELVSQSSFSDAHECKSIPIIAANVQRMIRPEQSQIWAVLRANDSVDRIYYSIISGFLGRLCLSGEIFDISEDKWNIVLEGIKFYSKIKDVIKLGKTTAIDCTARDYNYPQGYQVVKRELNDTALLIVHTFENSACLDLSAYINGYEIVDSFGSDLSGDFQSLALVLKKRSN